jgi:long-chain acyl-CoA synthetase
MADQWGTEIRRRERGIPFRCYHPRPHHVLDLLDEARTWGDRDHLVQGGRRLTFQQATQAIERVASLLADRGLGAGDRILILAPNSPEWVVTLWAAWRIGAVPALGNGWWSAPEVAHAVGLVTPRLVLADERRGELLPEDLTDHLVGLTEARAAVDAEGAAVERARSAAGDEDDPAVIIFTAGTTGFPKAVTLAHRSVVANLHGLLAVSGRLPQQLDRSRPGAVVLLSGPLFHIGGLQSLLMGAVGGSRLVFLEGRFDAGQVIDLIEREGVTVWGAIPTMASRVIEHPSATTRDLSRVRSISMGGMPVLPELSDRLRRVFTGAERGLSTIYGMTETGGTVASASGRLMAEHPLTSGRPMPVVDLRIDDPNEQGIGEIVVRTPGQMLGYWQGGGVAPADDIIDSDGWLRTGDLGRFDGELLWVTGRSKDVIIRGGENISAAHVEQELLTHPAVAVVAVVGLPDPDVGERVGAVVQVRPGAVVTEQELCAHAGERLARFEVPESWWVRSDEIPMTDAGKVEKHRLREAWLALGDG